MRITMVRNLKKYIFHLLLSNDHLDHHLHCHHDADDTIHLRMGESQTLKGTCILVTCKDPDTNLLEETR